MAYITIPSGTSIPTSLYDGNTVAWYDYNASTATMSIYDPSTTVLRWNDQLGSGRDLIQNTSTARPTWSSNGVLFDGIDDYLKATTFTYNQPEMIYMVLKQVTWTLNDYLFDGSTLTSGVLYQASTTPELKGYAGTVSTQNNNLVVNTFGIIRVLFNGASSKLIVNNTTPTTWSCEANNMNGITLATRGIFDGQFGNIQFKEIILRNVADSDKDESNIYNYLSNKYMGTNLGFKYVTFNDKYITY